MTNAELEAIACEGCGRAIGRTASVRWYAVKGEERGYDPLACEASDDGRHEPAEDVVAVVAFRETVLATLRLSHRPYTDATFGERCFTCVGRVAYPNGVAMHEPWPCPTARALVAIGWMRFDGSGLLLFESARG